MGNENYDGPDARLCPFCETTFSADSDKCLAVALDSLTAHREQITALRSLLSRVREWVDNAALVESEEREIRGILEEGK